MHMVRYDYRIFDSLSNMLFPPCIVLLVMLALPLITRAQNLQENMWVTNGTVSSVATNQDGSTIYVGGSFDYVGPVTGYGGALDLTTAEADSAMPKVNGTIHAVVSDGAGGWYVGGSFSQVGGLIRNNLVRIKADKSVDPAFSPHVYGPVYALVLAGDTLFVGGSFWGIGDSTRYNIAALDGTDGNVMGWVPSGFYQGVNAQVAALVLSGSTLYVGGSFTQVGDSVRRYITALDFATANVLNWNPNANSSIQTLAISGSNVYAGGWFDSVGGAARRYIAAIDTATGLATSWDPGGISINSGVNAIVVSGGVVYAGGWFTNIGNQARSYIAALDPTTGNATSWNPNANNYVQTLAVSGSTVYAGGQFTAIGGQPRRYLAGIDLVTGNATSWDSHAGSTVNCFAISGSSIYVGGSFTSIGGKRRRNIAAFDAITGRATSWDPSANSSVSSIAVSGATVYAGGSFDSVGGQWRRFIGAVDTVTGTATSWDPSAGNTNSYVSAIAPAGATVYVGGSFWLIGGQSRNYIAAIDSATGNITGWDPNSNGYVNTLAINGSTVYAGGSFSQIGSESRQNLAALDATTGNATSWNPSPDGGINTVSIDGSTLYVGGSFLNIAGQVRQSLAAFSTSTGNLTLWNPGTSWPHYTTSLALNGSTVYVGGNFSSIGGQPRSYIASVSASTGLATSWAPQINGWVYSLALANSKVYVGGGFSSVNNSNWRQYFAALDTEEPAFFSVDSLNFGGVRKDTSKADTVYIKNAGSSVLTLDYAWSGSWPFYSDPSGSVNQAIVPGDSFGIAVTFTPSNSVGFYTGTLYLQFNSSWSHNIYLSGAGTDSTFSVNLHVTQGWNLVSNPVVTTNDSVHQLFTTASFPYAFRFIPGAGYAPEYRTFSGRGYWVKFPSAFGEWLSGAPIEEDSIAVSAGWNLIGSISVSVDTAFIKANSNPPNIITSNFFGYPYGAGDPSVEPGRGYWVKTNAAGKLYVAQNPAPTRPAGAVEESPLSHLNQLVIADASGKTQTLYFGADRGDGLNVTVYELPPLPPAGAFDARFESADGGFAVQVHPVEGGSFPVAIQSDAYPVTIEWSITDGAYTLAGGGSVASVSRSISGKGSMKIINAAVNRVTLTFEGSREIPTEFSLRQNYPNPFNPATTISFGLPRDARVTMRIFNLLGQQVAEIEGGEMSAGFHHFRWEGKSTQGMHVGSGVYFYRLEASPVDGSATYVDVKKMLLLK